MIQTSPSAQDKSGLGTSHLAEPRDRRNRNQPSLTPFPRSPPSWPKPALRGGWLRGISPSPTPPLPVREALIARHRATNCRHVSGRVVHPNAHRVARHSRHFRLPSVVNRSLSLSFAVVFRGVGAGCSVGCRGSGKWLIRSVDVRGQVDRAGFLSRPAVPSRARSVGQSRRAGRRRRAGGRWRRRSCASGSAAPRAGFLPSARLRR